MQLQSTRELLSDYVSGDLDAALTVSLENQLQQDASLREEAEGLRQVWAGLDALPREDPPAFFHENLMHRLNAQIYAAEQARVRPYLSLQWWLQPRMLAGAVAAVAVLWFVIAAPLQGRSTNDASLNPFHLPHRTTPVNAPTLKTARAEWMPSSDGGTLALHLQAAPRTDGQPDTLAYKLEWPGHTLDKTTGNIVSDRETLDVLTLNTPLADADIQNAHITLTLRRDGAGSDPNATTRLEIPLTLAASGGDPTSPR